MKKVDLLVKGNIISNVIGGGAKALLNIQALSNPDNYDLTNAIIIEGNLNIKSIKGFGFVICTGAVVAIGEEEDNVSI